MTKTEAYQEWIEADRTWSKLLKEAFGKYAGDARYTAEGKGPEGSTLRAAADAFDAARRQYATF